MGPATLTWPGHSDTANLYMEHVQREDDGTRFTCRLETDGYKASKQYALRVAYGPSSEHLHVNITYTVNTTTGEPTFHLTCLATDVYPAPDYSWSHVSCNNGTTSDVCSFTPGPDEHRIVPTCAAERPFIDGYGTKTAQSDSATVWLIYEAKVEHFTLNETEGTLTANGSDHETFKMACKAYGRPPPTVLKITKPGNASFASTSTITEKGNWSRKTTIVLSDIQCRDMGTYSCTAHNGVGLPDTRSIMLNVRCPPRKYFDESFSMNQDGIKFTLEAYPVPDDFHFTHLGNTTSNPGQNAPPDMFSSYCVQHEVTTFMVSCVIVPRTFSKEILGFYTTTVSNGLGSVNIGFYLHREGTGIPVLWIMLGGAAATGIVLLNVIILAVVCGRRESP
ncbi:hypothetical protein V1264_017762 [Littorina saxatilis]|uniref:Ig-like domain-containing protein n=1 Tax=Littorina saxatilis TaxID=31220 RepID=A0AAN9BJV2_9CAEN